MGFKTVIFAANAGWGIYRYRAALMQALIKRGWRVVAVADWSDGFESQVRALGVETASVKIAGASINPFADMRTLWQLFWTYRQFRPDAVVHYTIKPVIYGSIVARLLGVRRIVNNITGLGVLFLPQFRWLKFAVSPLYKIALGGRSITIFQNPDDRAMLLSLGFTPEERTRLIPSSGIDTDALRPDPSLSSQDRRTVIMASRMLWTKGVREFVEAAELLKPRFPHIRFVLMGGSREDYSAKNPDFVARDWLEDVNRQGVVEWWGLQAPEAVDKAFRSAAIIALPSYYPEGVPRCLIEAASAGVAIVTTDTPGCRDTVTPGQNGYFCEPRSSASLADAMAEILGSPERIARFGTASREIAVSRFDLRKIVAAQIEVCETP